MKQMIIISVSVLVFFFQNKAQSVDSLQNELKKAKEDSGKVLLLITLGQRIENENPKAAKTYYLQARDISKKINYPAGLIKFYLNYTAVLNLQGQYDSSLQLNLEAVELAKEKGSAMDIAKCIQNTGVSWYYLQDYEKSADWYLQAIPYFEKTNDTFRLSVLYSNIGIAYREARLLQKSLEYQQKALELTRKLNDPYETGLTLSNIGIVYADLKQFDKAEAVLNEAKELARQTNDHYLLEQVMINTNNLYLKKREYGKMKPFAEEALRYSSLLGDSLVMSISLYTLALEAFHRKDFSAALSYANKGLAIASAKNFKEQMQHLYQLQSSLSLIQQDIAAYEKNKFKADSIGELVLNAAIQKNIQLLDKRFETEKKNHEILQLSKDKKVKTLWNYILGGIAASVLIISLLAYRGYRQKQKWQQQQIAALEKEKQLLATQSLLKGQEEERSRLAKDLHDGLGGLLSGVKLQLGAMKGNLILSEEHGRMFSNALNKLDESIHEMRRVAHNMMPEALLKFGLQQALQDYCDNLAEGQAFTINTEFYGLEKRMQPGTEVVVYRIVQELLNNAVKHSGATSMLAQVIRQDDNLTITVEDNGKGFDTHTVLQGSGLKNIRSRVEYLKGTMDIKSAPGKGTSVHIDCVIDSHG